METAASKGDTAPAEWRIVAVASAVGTIGSFIFMVLPLFIASLVDSGAFTGEQAGIIGASPLLGMFAGSLAFAGAMTRISRKAAVAGGSAGLALAYVLSLPVAGLFAPFVAIQFLGGVAGVVLLSVAFAAIGRTKAPDRNFGIFITVQMSAGALGTLAIEAIVTRYGLPGVLIGMAVLSLLPLLMAGSLPPQETGEATPSPAAAARHGFAAAGVVGAQIAFGIGIMIMWSSAARIGAARGWEPGFVAQALSLSLFAGIGGALLASVIGSRIPRLRMLVAGTALILPATILAAVASTPLAFAVAIMVFAFCWNFLPAFQLGLAADLGGSGRVLVLCIAALKLGYSLGTASGGFLDSGGVFITGAAVACGAFVVSLLLLAGCVGKPGAA